MVSYALATVLRVTAMPFSWLIRICTIQLLGSSGGLTKHWHAVSGSSRCYHGAANLLLRCCG